MLRIHWLLVLLLMGLLILLVGCAPLTLPTPAPDPEAVDESPADPRAALIVGLSEAFNAGDLEAVMAHYADDATVYFLGLPPTGFEVYRGEEQIRPVWADNIANHLVWEVEIDSVSGDVVRNRAKTWHDFTRQIGVAPLHAHEVWVIRDGKVATHAWTVTEEDVLRIKAALAEAMPDEAVPEPVAEMPVSALTVTFADGTCSYDGPLTLQAGDVEVTVDVQDQDSALYAMTFFTLDPDKDFMDLMASTVRAGPPDWSNMFFLREIGPGENQTYKLTVTAGPVYGVCWSQSPALAIGSIGPFVVSE